jgi:hypothetical protein
VRLFPRETEQPECNFGSDSVDERFMIEAGEVVAAHVKALNRMKGEDK